MIPSKEHQLFAELWGIADQLAICENGDDAAYIYQNLCQILFKYERVHDEEEE